MMCNTWGIHIKEIIWDLVAIMPTFRKNSLLLEATWLSR